MGKGLILNRKCHVKPYSKFVICIYSQDMLTLLLHTKTRCLKPIIFSPYYIARHYFEAYMQIIHGALHKKFIPLGLKGLRYVISCEQKSN
jgi:hypothetical protein